MKPKTDKKDKEVAKYIVILEHSCFSDKTFLVDDKKEAKEKGEELHDEYGGELECNGREYTITVAKIISRIVYEDGGA